MTNPHRVLKAYRKLKDTNQQFMADLIGVKVNAYNLKENGKCDFTLPEAKVIADFFGMQIEDIFFNEEVSKLRT